MPWWVILVNLMMVVCQLHGGDRFGGGGGGGRYGDRGGNNSRRGGVGDEVELLSGPRWKQEESQHHDAFPPLIECESEEGSIQ